VEPTRWVSEDGERIATSYVVFDDEDPSLTERDIFDHKPGPEPDEEGRTQAREFLQSWLEQGPIGAKEVQRAAHDAGVSGRMLRAARRELGIVVERQHAQDGRIDQWTWRLPTATERW